MTWNNHIQATWTILSREEMVSQCSFQGQLYHEHISGSKYIYIYSIYIYSIYIYGIYIYIQYIYIYCIYISDGLFQIVTNTWLTSETQQKTSLLAFGRIAPFLQRIQPFKPTNHQPVSATGRDAVVGAWNMDRMRNLLPGLQKKLGNLTWTVNYHPNHSLGLDYLKSMVCLQEIVVTTDCTIWYGVLSEIKDLLPRCEILESHSLSHEMFFLGSNVETTVIGWGSAIYLNQPRARKLGAPTMGIPELNSLVASAAASPQQPPAVPQNHNCSRLLCGNSRDHVQQLRLVWPRFWNRPLTIAEPWRRNLKLWPAVSKHNTIIRQLASTHFLHCTQELVPTARNPMPLPAHPSRSHPTLAKMTVFRISVQFKLEAASCRNKDCQNCYFTFARNLFMILQPIMYVHHVHVWYTSCIYIYIRNMDRTMHI